MNFEIKVSSARVVRASTGKSANVVRINDVVNVNVWPRDVNTFKADLENGVINVTPRAAFQYDENGPTFGAQNKVRVDEKETPLLRVEYQYVGNGGDLAQLVGEPKPELVGEQPAAHDA